MSNILSGNTMIMRLPKKSAMMGLATTLSACLTVTKVFLSGLFLKYNPMTAHRIRATARIPAISSSERVLEIGSL